MKIDLSRMSNHDLARLIRGASALLANRLDESPDVVREPAPRPVVSVSEPPPEDKDFALYIKGQLQSGQYISASDRRQIARIAEQYTQWVCMQGLPTVHNAGAWDRARQYASAPRAREV